MSTLTSSYSKFAEAPTHFGASCVDVSASTCEQTVNNEVGELLGAVLDIDRFDTEDRVEVNELGVELHQALHHRPAQARCGRHINGSVVSFGDVGDGRLEQPIGLQPCGLYPFVVGVDDVIAEDHFAMRRVLHAHTDVRSADRPEPVDRIVDPI